MKKTRNKLIISLLLSLVMLFTTFGALTVSASDLKSESCNCTVACSDTGFSSSCPVCNADYTKCVERTYWVKESEDSWVMYNGNGDIVKFHNHIVVYYYHQAVHYYKCVLEEYCPAFNSTDIQYFEAHTWGSNGQCIFCKFYCEHTYVLGCCPYCGVLETKESLVKGTIHHSEGI